MQDAGTSFAVAAIALVVLSGTVFRGWALLLVYWALSLPVLGQELGFLIAQYPHHRNVTLRLVEPLSAPEVDSRQSTVDSEQGS